jgi:hypothetical protein
MDRIAPPFSLFTLHLYLLNQSNQIIMDIDKPLDDLIKTKRAERRASKPRGAGGANANKPKAAGGARDRYAGNAPRSAGGRAPAPAAPKGGAPGNLAAEATKIIISNLPADVNEAAVRVGHALSIQIAFFSRRGRVQRGWQVLIA